MSAAAGTYPFVMDTLPEKYLQVAQKELNETPEKRTEFVQDLMTKAKSNEMLSGTDFHPDFLLQILRINKFNIDLAFKRLCKYAYFRKKHSWFFTGIDEDKLTSCPSYKWMGPLPWRCADGCAIGIYECGKLNMNEITFEEMMRLGYLIYQLFIRDPATQISGSKLIIDFENITYHLLKHITPRNMYLVSELYLECNPVRLKQVHCLNSNWIMRTVMTLFFPFMSGKIKKRVIFHEHPEDLLKYFPKQVLPVQYGGDLEDYYMYTWVKEANCQIKLCTLSGQANIY